MLITKMFLALVLATLIYTSSTMSALNNTTKVDTPTELQTLQTTLSIQVKMDRMLEQLERSLQNIAEKANTWALFQHHIDAWNDQMKSIEQKLNLIKRTQEEQHHKLTALEFTQNHVLSKVVFLSESCVTKPSSCRLYANERTTDEANNFSKRKLNEISQQLSHILRHFNNDNYNKTINSIANKNTNKNKPAKANIVLPPACHTNTNQQFEQLFKQLQRKFTTLVAGQPTKKDFQQIQEMAKKNGKTLDSLNKSLEHFNQKQTDDSDNWHRLYEHCSSVKSELTTFTTSSDLLLKVIEKTIKKLYEKFYRDIENRYDKIPITTPTIAVISEDIDITDTTENELVDNEESFIKINVEDNDNDGNDEDKNDANEITNSNDEDNDSSQNTDVEVDVIDYFKIDQNGCHELPLYARVDGVYKFGTTDLNEAGRDFNERYCAFATDGPAWTIIHNRNSYYQQENFNRSWQEYSCGFGNLNQDFWFGNDFIYKLTYNADYELRIEMEDFEDESVWVEYSTFHLEHEFLNYRLTVNGYRGSVGDAMAYHNSKDFSTYDRRNDRTTDACCSCAMAYGSGWWFDKCFEANLNGIYLESPWDHNDNGIIWEPWHSNYSLKSARMLIRPRNAATIDVDTEIAEDILK